MVKVGSEKSITSLLHGLELKVIKNYSNVICASKQRWSNYKHLIIFVLLKVGVNVYAKTKFLLF